MFDAHLFVLQQERKEIRETRLEEDRSKYLKETISTSRSRYRKNAFKELHQQTSKKKRSQGVQRLSPHHGSMRISQTVKKDHPTTSRPWYIKKGNPHDGRMFDNLEFPSGIQESKSEY